MWIHLNGREKKQGGRLSCEVKSPPSPHPHYSYFIFVLLYFCGLIFVISLCVYMARENNAPMEKIQYSAVSPHIETVHCVLLWNLFCYFVLLCFLFLYFHFAERKKICVGWLCCTQSSPSDPPLKSPLSALCCSLAHKIGEILQGIQFYIGNFGQIWY